MRRTPIDLDRENIPAQFHSLLDNAEIFDSSSSPEARVYFIQKEGGYYLKSASRNSLKTEAEMTAFFHRHGIGAEVLAYHTDSRDWLLTRQVSGEDCTDPFYRAEPKRLAETIAHQLRHLHNLGSTGCPVPDRTAAYLATARRNYENQHYDASLFPDNWGYTTPEEAWKVIEENGHLLKTDTLLHGDYCLPNIMLDNWRFSGFIDVGNGGVGDKHIDLFWGIWSLGFNLKTDAYRDCFLDAYGREAVEPEMFRLIAACEVFG